MPKLKAPPYSKTFCTQPGQLPLAWLYIGPFAWNAKKHPMYTKNQAVVLPPSEKAEDFNWTFLAGKIVLVNCCGETDKSYRKEIAIELFLAGAKHVRFFLPQLEVIGLDYPDFNGDDEREAREAKKHISFQQAQESYYLSNDGSEFEGLVKR
jgi:hypothetical protein